MPSEMQRLFTQEDLDEGADSTSGVDYDQTFRRMGQGHVVKGMVVSVSTKEVVVDIGYKS